MPRGSEASLVVASALLLTAACRAAPAVDPYAVRVSVRGALAAPEGFVRATEDPAEAEGQGSFDPDLLIGDRVRLGRDAGIRLSRDLGASAEVRPHPDLLLEGQFGASGLDGAGGPGRRRRFDGSVYGEGEKLRLEVEWTRFRAALGGRLAAVDAGLRLDLLGRAGFERDNVRVEIKGSRTLGEDRDLRLGAPWGGLEARWAVSPRATASVRLDAGYVKDHRNELGLVDFETGLRLGLGGPFDVGIFYAVHHRRGRSGAGRELSTLSHTTHGIGLELGAGF